MIRKVKLALLGSIIMAGCGDKEVLYQRTDSISGSGWHKDDGLFHELQIENPLIPYDFYVSIRNHKTYGYANLYLFIDAMFPDSTVYRDTIECFLSNIKGQWLGNVTGELVDNKILFKRGVKLPKRGNYSFSFYHGMRQDTLEGIKDFGLIIEKSE